MEGEVLPGVPGRRDRLYRRGHRPEFAGLRMSRDESAVAVGVRKGGLAAPAAENRHESPRASTEADLNLVRVGMTELPEGFVDNDEQIVLVHVVKVRVFDRMPDATGTTRTDRPRRPQCAGHHARQAKKVGFLLGRRLFHGCNGRAASFG